MEAAATAAAMVGEAMVVQMEVQTVEGLEVVVKAAGMEEGEEAAANAAVVARAGLMAEGRMAEGSMAEGRMAEGSMTVVLMAVGKRGAGSMGEGSTGAGSMGEGSTGAGWMGVEMTEVGSMGVGPMGVEPLEVGTLGVEPLEAGLMEVVSMGLGAMEMGAWEAGEGTQEKGLPAAERQVTEVRAEGRPGMGLLVVWRAGATKELKVGKKGAAVKEEGMLVGGKEVPELPNPRV
ncbi:hypothetical protein AB1Y20_006127 [Prymnesium parvum]|uniref:Uncharacterized protein n=1 Tax=Prymnesium parvum TaxID=97485 RepID=A0AB34J1R0_PRYPA